MERIKTVRFLIAIFLFAFWILLSNKLTLEPSLTSTTIFFSLGMLAVVTIIIELVWRKDIEERMKKILDSEIRDTRKELIEELQNLISYLKEEKYPTFSNSEVEALSNDLQALNSIKSKFTVAPKIVWSTIFIVLSSMLLFLFWIDPNLLVFTSTEGAKLTLAHCGVGLLVIGLWLLFDILTIVLEVKFWERE